MPAAPMMLVDTGADGTLLPIYSAKFLGFGAADLREEPCTVAGGTVTVYRPQDLAGTEIEIDGAWLALPSLAFVEQTLFPLLGRDIIFSHFDLMMTSIDFELLPKKT